MISTYWSVVHVCTNCAAEITRIQIKFVVYNLFWRPASAWRRAVPVSVSGDERPCDVGGSPVSEHMALEDMWYRR